MRAHAYSESHASNMFQESWNRGNKRPEYAWNAPKTSVWNIPQVNRLIGTRWEYHDAVSKRHSWEAHSFPSKVGPSISAPSNVHLYKRRLARGFGNTGAMLVSLSVWGLYIGSHSFSIPLRSLNQTLNLNMLNPNHNRTSIHTLALIS